MFVMRRHGAHLLLVTTNKTCNIVALKYFSWKRSAYNSSIAVAGWVGVTVDTFSENGMVLSYKLTEGNHIGDGNIWEFCLTDAHFNKFHSAS